MPPTALVVANANAAIGVLRAAHKMGVRVPKDISVVAIHDSWVAEFSSPPLTVMRMPLYELGRAAVASLSARMSDTKTLDVTVLEPPPELVLRESTASPTR